MEKTGEIPKVESLKRYFKDMRTYLFYMIFLLLFSSLSFAQTSLKSGLHRQSVFEVKKGETLVLSSGCDPFIIEAEKIVINGKIISEGCDSAGIVSLGKKSWFYEAADGSSGESTGDQKGGSSNKGNGGGSAGIENSGARALAFQGGAGGGDNAGSGGSFSKEPSQGSLGSGNGGGSRGLHGQILILRSKSIEGTGVIDLSGKKGQAGAGSYSFSLDQSFYCKEKVVCTEPSTKGGCSRRERRYEICKETKNVLVGAGGNGAGGNGGYLVISGVKPDSLKVLLNGGSSGGPGASEGHSGSVQNED